MASPTPTPDRLRRLSELEPDTGRVLSVYMNLDPSQFATPPARASQITSLLTEARSLVEAATGLEHDEHEALRADLERVEEQLRADDIAGDGVRGLAVFAAGTAGVLEVLRLPQVVDAGVFLDRRPHIEPLVAFGRSERWAVLLCNRRVARIFTGRGAAGLEETDRVEDEVHSQHHQGGWSQGRYQRAIEEQVYDHLDHAAEVLLALHKRRPIDRLLVAAPSETVDELEHRLHPYLKERLAGRLSLDVENAGLENVREALEAAIDEHRVAREDEILGRLKEGLARGERAAAGSADVESALEQARVEVLLLDEGVDGAEDLIARAYEQAAEVLTLRERPDLGPHEGIAAVLRF